MWSLSHVLFPLPTLFFYLFLPFFLPLPTLPLPSPFPPSFSFPTSFLPPFLLQLFKNIRIILRSWITQNQDKDCIWPKSCHLPISGVEELGKISVGSWIPGSYRGGEGASAGTTDAMWWCPYWSMSVLKYQIPRHQQLCIERCGYTLFFPPQLSGHNFWARIRRKPEKESLNRNVIKWFWTWLEIIIELDHFFYCWAEVGLQS